MLKKGGEQKNNNNQEIQPFHAKYAITSTPWNLREHYYRFIKCKIGGYRVDS
jgi:hypothetical protein